MRKLAVVAMVAACLATSPLAQAAKDVSWAPTSISQSLRVGGTREVTVAFTAGVDAGNVDVWIVPALSPYIELRPTSFPSLTKGGRYEISLTLSAASDSPIGGVDGTVHLRQGQNTLASPLPIQLDIQPASEMSFTILDVTPDATAPGETVVVTVGGLPAAGPVVAQWGRLSINTSPGSSGTQRVFVVPAEATTGPLSLRQDGATTNSIMLSVSDTRLLSPLASEVVPYSAGVDVVVNQLLVYFRPSVQDPHEQIERIAALYGANVVGQIPLLGAYQLRFPSVRDLAALNSLQQALSLDAAVDRVVHNFRVEDDDQADWSLDPDVYPQRLQNCVEEGAALYTARVDPLAPGALRPTFMSIHDSDEYVDFDNNDFDGYSSTGTNRSNNIAVFAADLPGRDWSAGYSRPDQHGTLVTGVLAAELDGWNDLGGGAGLLQGLISHHGGFNIDTSCGDCRDPDRVASTIRALGNGARVINWSFGRHRSGAITASGSPVTNNVSPDSVFDEAQYQYDRLLSLIERDYPNVVVVASAGNGNTDSSDRYYRTPSSNTSPNLIVVGAHESYGALECGSSAAEGPPRWAASNYGDRVDVAAGAWARPPSGPAVAGTSISTPLVASTVAAMLSINPNLSPGEIRQLLRSSAMGVRNTVTRQESSGTALPDAHFTRPLSAAEVGVGDVRVGFGARLDVRGAIQAAIASLEDSSVRRGDQVVADFRGSSCDPLLVPVDVTLPSDPARVFDKVDIVFVVDVSGSYFDDLAQFRNQAGAIVGSFLTAGQDVRMGLTSFSDFRTSPYGCCNDYPYRLDQPLTADWVAFSNALNSLTIQNGSDTSESQLEALFRTATSADIGWRPGALRIIFLATDANFHDSDLEPAYPGTGRIETLSALGDMSVRVFGLQSGGDIADVASIAADTGGGTFALSSNSAEVAAAVYDALREVASSVDIQLVRNGDFGQIVRSISPSSYSSVGPGETRTFDLTFDPSEYCGASERLTFAFRLEVVAEEIALIEEIPVTVIFGGQGSW